MIVTLKNQVMKNQLNKLYLPSQAYEALDSTMKWLESQDDTDPAHLLLVQKWRDMAAIKRTETLKQKNYILF